MLNCAGSREDPRQLNFGQSPSQKSSSQGALEISHAPSLGWSAHQKSEIVDFRGDAVSPSSGWNCLQMQGALHHLEVSSNQWVRRSYFQTWYFEGSVAGSPVPGHLHCFCGTAVLLLPPSPVRPPQNWPRRSKHSTSIYQSGEKSRKVQLNVMSNYDISSPWSIRMAVSSSKLPARIIFLNSRDSLQQTDATCTGVTETPAQCFCRHTKL